MPEPSPKPDLSAVRADLEHMVRRWGELDEPCLFELRAFKEGTQPHTAKFSPDWIEDAVEWAASMNALGRNIYVVRNPIRQDCSGSASDEDIVASFYLWADCDDERATGNVSRFDGPKWTNSVTTGTVPHQRVHAYWELEEPCTDLEEWREMQSQIAQHFGSDRAVINPSRIMRLGGTVSHPAKNKQEKGYVPEVCILRTEYEDARAPVTFDQMRRVFGAQSAQASILAINTGAFAKKHTEDYADALRRARTDGEKHTGVRDLTASLAGAGVPQAMCEAIIRESCPVWDHNVDTLIRSAYQRFYREPERVAEQAQSITDFRLQSSSEFLADLRAPSYVVDGVLGEGRCHSLTGFAGHGKTTLALHLAISVATGGLFGGRECAKGSVAILAGENPDNVKWQFAAAIRAAGVNVENLPIHFLSGHFLLSQFESDLKAELSKHHDLRLVITDSLQAFFEGENDNGNVEMIEAARRFRALSELPQKPASIVIAHPAGKRPDRENIVPRGGSAFGNELDGNFTVWAEPDGTQIFHHSEKHRGAPFEPINFVMEEREFEDLVDSKGTPLKLKFCRQQLQLEQMNAAKKRDDADRRIIEILDGDPKATVRSVAEKLRMSRSAAGRQIQKMQDDKLIKKKARKWVITTEGREYYEDV